MRKWWILVLGLGLGGWVGEVKAQGVDSCCRGHGGVVFCDGKRNRLRCYDGTDSQICSCGGFIGQPVAKTITVVKKAAPTATPTVLPTPTIVGVTPTLEVNQEVEGKGGMGWWGRVVEFWQKIVAVMESK